MIGFAALYRALAVGAMSVVAPVSATAALVPVIVGVAAGEAPTIVQALGITLALGGAGLVVGHIAQTGFANGDNRRRHRHGQQQQQDQGHRPENQRQF